MILANQLIDPPTSTLLFRDVTPYTVHATGGTFDLLVKVPIQMPRTIWEGTLDEYYAASAPECPKLNWPTTDASITERSGRPSSAWFVLVPFFNRKLRSLITQSRSSTNFCRKQWIKSKMLVERCPWYCD
jgi:hypothetical protein